MQPRRSFTTLSLKALRRDDDGRTISLGDSMIGKVRARQDAVVSVHVSWRYRFGGKAREIRIGTWQDGTGASLKAIRDERDDLAALLRSGVDPIEHKAAEKLRQESERAAQERRLREELEAAAKAELERQRRLSVSQLFWRPRRRARASTFRGRDQEAGDATAFSRATPQG